MNAKKNMPQGSGYGDPRDIVINLNVSRASFKFLALPLSSVGHGYGLPGGYADTSTRGIAGTDTDRLFCTRRHTRTHIRHTHTHDGGFL
jgi:hypothetical protein